MPYKDYETDGTTYTFITHDGKRVSLVKDSPEYMQAMAEVNPPEPTFAPEPDVVPPVEVKATKPKVTRKIKRK